MTDQIEPERHPLLPIGFLIRKVYQKNQAIWQSMCPDQQMTSMQSATLTVLDHLGPCSLTELGRAAAMDPATTRGVVERLHQRGMIALMDDPADKRKVIVRLEPPALRFLEIISPIMPRITDATLKPLNIAERLALEFLLLKLTEADAVE
jgi:MarR family transcriptional regulator, lower aerobic nicotinate degradation pathway regulator